MSKCKDRIDTAGFRKNVKITHRPETKPRQYLALAEVVESETALSPRKATA